MEFDKYRVKGAYHWRDIGYHLLKSNASVKYRYTKCINLLHSGFESIDKQYVLDLGCGDGALSYLLSIQGFNVCGIDVSELGIKLAVEEHKKRNSQVLFKCCSTKELDNQMFDGVICSDVIEHVEHPTELIKEVLRVLKPGGTAVFSTPIRLTENPLDREHVVEWWEREWQEMFSFTNAVTFTKSHPVTLMELMNNPRSRIMVNLLSYVCDIFKERHPFRLYALQYAVLTKDKY